MKQKIITGLATLFLLLAVVLIARDLFRDDSFTDTSSLVGEAPLVKQFDTALIGYIREDLWETGLNSLTGISVDAHRVIVCGDKLVAIYDTSGNKTGGFYIDSSATCIAVENNHILIGTRSAAIRFDFSGKIITTFEIPSSGSWVTSIAADGKYVYIADAGKKRVLKYNYDGHFVKEFSKKDCCSNGTGFIIPSPYFDIDCGGYNDLWIANPGKHRIESYSASGKLRSAWGEDVSLDARFTGCCNPSHFSILPDGGFVTYEKGNDKIKVFDMQGQFRTMVGGAGTFKGKSDFMLGRNNLVKDLDAGESGSVYILDAYNRINVFRPKI